MKSFYLKIMGLKIEILRKLTCANLKLNFSTAKFHFQYSTIKCNQPAGIRCQQYA